MRSDIRINEHAVSTVVSAILLLAVLTTFLAAINSYYIPSLIADHEIHHMQDVRNSFMEIAAAASPGSSKERVLVPLGDGGMPFISSLSSSGTLIVSSDKGKIEITMTGARPVEYQQLEFKDDTTIQNIQSLSHLMLIIEDSDEDGVYSATIDNTEIKIVVNSNTVSVDSPGYSGTVLRNSPQSFCLDLLNPAYGFDEIVADAQNSPPFNLELKGATNSSYFDAEFTILLNDIDVNPISAQGQIRYISGNNQWIDQDYIFEGGAVILKQGSNSTIRSQPFFRIDDKNIELCLFNINTDASISGNGAVVVNVFGTEGKKYEYRNVENTTITVHSLYTEAWYNYFSKCGGNPETDNGKITVSFPGRNVSIITSDVHVILPK